MKKLIFIGSSVCNGYGASNEYGWSAYLADELRQQGWTVSNCSINGQNTADILLRLERDVLHHQPDVCVIGLGLANEGMARAKEVETQVVRGVFESNLKKIADTLHKAGIRPILGGVYPNNEYNAEQYAALKQTYHAMEQWGYPVLQWLDAIEDGAGHFRENLFSDAWHPNDAGYRVMAEQVDLGIF